MKERFFAVPAYTTAEEIRALRKLPEADTKGVCGTDLLRKINSRALGNQ